MKRFKTPRAEDWQTTNPGYQRGAVRKVRIRTESGQVLDCVEIDATTWWEYQRDQRILNPKRFKQ